ncbi:hypothetical protein [Pseudomonas putida]|uniref:hypothetical protein n=1 Tax=Pseudomonas putida TaxID=303 RepID=UPI00037C8513|nr:hypothetical protein [Pseudomonas putida]
MSKGKLATGQAFDNKNQEDFDRNTEILTNGLMQIAGSLKLKPTVAELSRITGIHRNTIRQRIWPGQRLSAIKESRALEALRSKLAKEKKADPVTVLTDKLQASRLEVLHWFNYANALSDKRKKLKEELAIQMDSKAYYVKRAGELQERNLALQSEIDRLLGVIEVLESSQDEKNS